METIFNIIAQHIKDQVPQIAWIDFDNGQLDYQEYRAAIAFPAVLIDIAFTQCHDLGHSGTQLCDVQLQLKVVSQQFDETNIAAPEKVRQRAFEHFGLLAQIQKALQWHIPPDSAIDTITRTANIRQPRQDGLAVQLLTYNTRFYDLETSAPDSLVHYPADFDMRTG